MMDAVKKKGVKNLVVVASIIPQIEILTNIVGKQVKHKVFGFGEITAIEGISIVVRFDKVGLKKMGYEFCKEKKFACLKDLQVYYGGTKNEQ